MRVESSQSRRSPTRANKKAEIAGRKNYFLICPGWRGAGRGRDWPSRVCPRRGIYREASAKRFAEASFVFLFYLVLEIPPQQDHTGYKNRGHSYKDAE